MGTVIRCIGHDLDYVGVLAQLVGRVLTTGSPYGAAHDVPALSRE